MRSNSSGCYDPPHPLLSPPGVPRVGGGVGVGPVRLLPDVPGPLLRPGAGPAAGDGAEQTRVLLLVRVLADLHQQLALQGWEMETQRVKAGLRGRTHNRVEGTCQRAPG